jgi:hypothetical protein
MKAMKAMKAMKRLRVTGMNGRAVELWLDQQVLSLLESQGSLADTRGTQVPKVEA